MPNYDNQELTLDAEEADEPEHELNERAMMALKFTEGLGTWQQGV